jgi:hypothetical protein
LVPANAVPHRLILSVLSNSVEFVRSGPASRQVFALRPNNPFSRSPSAVAASIEEILSKSGPLTLDQFRDSADFPVSALDVIEKVLSVHADEFTTLPDGRIWFVNSPVPVRAGFHSVQAAVEFGFSIFPQGATIEELRRLLCLATIDGLPITRIAIARELATRPQVFVQLDREKYALAGSDAARQRSPVAARTKAASVSPRTPPAFTLDDEDEPFNPESFFGGGFSFSPE